MVLSKPVTEDFNFGAAAAADCWAELPSAFFAGEGFRAGGMAR